MAREVFRNVDDGERFRNLMARPEGSPELVTLVEKTGPGGEVLESARYTTRAMLRVERMAEVASRWLRPIAIRWIKGWSTRRFPVIQGLSSEHRKAVTQMTSPRGIEVIAGSAGAGKSAAVAEAKQAWEASGYRLHGAAPSGFAAKILEKAPGVQSRTLARVLSKLNQAGAKAVLIGDAE